MSNTTFNERDLDFIVTALNAHWYDAHHNLERKDLGDIERKNYEFQLARSKELMGSIINPTPSKELKSAEADNLSIDELLSEFKRQGFDTSNWDGDEGAEKAIVDGVRNHIAELHPSPTHDVTQVEDGKQGWEIDLKEFSRCINALALELPAPVWDDVYNRWLKLKSSIIKSKSLPSTPVQPGERINKVKDAIGFLLSCAYPEMIASEYNRNKEVLTEICKLIDTIATSTPVQDGWVRVEDGLPEKFKKVAVVTNYKNIHTTCVNNSGGFDTDNFLYNDEQVTHWLEKLPSPPVNKQD